MGRIRIAAIGLLVALAESVQAGFYDPRHPTSPLVTKSGVRPLYYDQFRDEIDRLIAIGNPLRMVGPQAAARLATLKQRDQLISRGLSKLNPIDLAELGYVQWRLRDSDAALTTFKHAAIHDPRNFWALTNLGSAHQSLGQLREALPNLEAARDLFPASWPGGPPAADEWFKQAESYQFKLLRLRLREWVSRPPGARPMPAADVDALFDVHFRGPDGKYEAGKLAAAEQAKLPKDAIAIVQQLLLWFPEDTRLLWLLGELYNAEGNLEAAAKCSIMCVWSRRYESPALRDHRRIVQDAYEAQMKAAEQSPVPASQPAAITYRPAGSLYQRPGFLAFVLLLAGYWQISDWVRRFANSSRPAR